MEFRIAPKWRFSYAWECCSNEWLTAVPACLLACGQSAADQPTPGKSGTRPLHAQPNRTSPGPGSGLIFYNSLV
jgi:hypothetical protein